ncbi:MAG: J domain-containing protein [Deltaproteobacteria bacterium]|jgi:hypothetical protein|nr:J domain-containing protein [Deltaproteobacteria bacterium]
MKKASSNTIPPKNPFEIFGLTPGLVGALSEEDLFNVLKGLYRNLQKAFHPDTGKNGGDKSDRKAVELNLAFEELDRDKNLPSFRRHRKNYLLTHPANAFKTALNLRERLRVQTEREEKLADVFFDFLTRGAYPDDFREGSAFFPGGHPILPRNVLLGLQDVAIKNNLRHVSWLLGSNYKNIEINGDGELRIRAVGKRNFSLSRETTLIGCVPKDAVNITPLLERCPPSRIFKCPALTDYHPEALPQVTVRNFISGDNFKRHVLSSLRPGLMESAYLFSLNRLEYSNNGLIGLEGVIIKMENLENDADADSATGSGAV